MAHTKLEKLLVSLVLYWLIDTFIKLILKLSADVCLNFQHFQVWCCLPFNKHTKLRGCQPENF